MPFTDTSTLLWLRPTLVAASFACGKIELRYGLYASLAYRLPVKKSIPQSTLAHQQQASPVPDKSLCSTPAVFMPVGL